MKIALTTILTALLLTPLAVLPAAEQPNFVVIFIDDQFYSAFAPTRASNSVARGFNEPRLDHSGFRVPLAIAPPQQAASMEVRLFAISETGRVSELSYPSNSDQWPFKKNPAK